MFLQRGLEHPRMAFQRGARIDIDRRANRLSDHAQRQVFGVQDAVAVIKMIHLKRLSVVSRWQVKRILDAFFRTFSQFDAAFWCSLGGSFKQSFGGGFLLGAIRRHWQ